MIIKPQIYNLRLITYALFASVIVLGLNSYQNQSSLNEYHDFLLSEKASVEKELNKMFVYYDNLEIDNQELLATLDSYKVKLTSLIGDVKYAIADVQLMAHYKKQLNLLKEENTRILQLVDQLNAENEFLRQETLRFETELQESLVVSNALKSKNSNLSTINTSLNKKISEAKAIEVQNISVNGVRRITNSGKIKTTRSAKRTKKLNVCFDIAKNNFTTKGTKEIYVQIIDPKSNVVGDRGENLIGNSSLIFSKKIEVEYDNQQINECFFLEASQDETFSKGNYFIGLYHQNKLIGNSTLTLK